MTRQDFLDDVNKFEELIDFCNIHGCDILDDVIDRESYDSLVDDSIQDDLNHLRWYQIRDWLNSLPEEDFDYYQAVGNNEYEGLDDLDFEYFKDEVLKWADGCYVIFDECEDRAEDGAAEEPADPVSDMDIDLGFLLHIA